MPRKRIVQWSASWIIVLAVTVGRAPAGVHQTWDEAHFFKAATLQQVDQVLQDIRTRYGKDLMVETFASIPDHLKPALAKDGKDKFYQTWTRSEADQLEVNGIMILITGDPAHLQIEVGWKTQKQAFTLEDRDELVKLLGSAFTAKDFDGGLLQGVQFVRDRMARNMAGGGPPTTQPAVSSGQPAPPSDGPVAPSRAIQP